MSRRFDAYARYLHAQWVKAGMPPTTGPAKQAALEKILVEIDALRRRHEAERAAKAKTPKTKL